MAKEKGGKGLAALLVGGMKKAGEGEEGPGPEMNMTHEAKASCARDMMAALRADDVEMFMAALDDYLMYGQGDE